MFNVSNHLMLPLLPIFSSAQVPDEAVTKCTSCGTDFGAFVRRVNFYSSGLILFVDRLIITCLLEK